MDARALLNLFSSFTTLPINPDHVVEEIKRYGIKDEVEFIGVTMDVLVLRGSLCEFVRPSGLYGPPVVCAEIYYSLDQDQSWKRLVCCKELIHILDRTPSKTTDRQELECLLEDMADPSKMTSMTARNLASWTDYLTDLYAMAILFPFAAREVLMPAYEAGKITADDIAKTADLPLKVVGVVMSDMWPVIYASLNGPK